MKIMKFRLSTALLAATVLGEMLASNTDSQQAQAEYADVVLNEDSEEAGMRPVVCPHWFHRISFRCKVCDVVFFFFKQKTAYDINMVKIIDGQYCGACHD